MPDRNLQEKLNQAIDAMLAYGGFAPVAGTETKTTPLVRVAADLRGLPRENFKATLKAELIRRERPGMESKARRAETPKTVNYIREGFRTVSPYILVGGAA